MTGRHFDNSSFAVTMLLQAPAVSGRFEYVPSLRTSEAGDMGLERVADVLDDSSSAGVNQVAKPSGQA